MADTGAGTSPAGEEPCGEYVLPAATAARIVSAPASLYFDGATASNPLDANGRYLSLHPVDQAVALALIVRQGTISSAPNVGAKFRTIKKIVGNTTAVADDYARQALATLLAAKSISIRSIEVEAFPKTGGLAIAVNYVNLRTQKPQTARTVINGS